MNRVLLPPLLAALAVAIVQGDDEIPKDAEITNSIGMKLVRATKTHAQCAT